MVAALEDDKYDVPLSTIKIPVHHPSEGYVE